MILGMGALDQFINERLAYGRRYFTREEVQGTVNLKPNALTAAITRLVKRRRLANPRHGFYLILRPEDQMAGAPDPVSWIDPLMRHQRLDYRVSLLRAAAHHGSTHQAAMVFQVIAPRQMRDFEIGRHRLQFLYQKPSAFERVNQLEYLDQIKSETGFAIVAGVELTLLDCTRYFHKTGGLGGLAQIAKDLGEKLNKRMLAKTAAAYENASVRRLGYVLESVGHERKADALLSFARKAKTTVRLNPASKRLGSLPEQYQRNAKWKLVINELVEVDF